MVRVEGWSRRLRNHGAAGVLSLGLLGVGDVAGADDCCSCRFQATAPLAGSDILPCAFDHPEGWQPVAGDDGAAVHVAVTKPPCAAPCAGSPGVAFSVARKPNPNAETMEGIWRQAMKVVGTARCGGQPVTFFLLPGADPAGLTGGLRFHVAHRGNKYAANVTFICSRPGEWLLLQELFVRTFRTNERTTFSGR
jgi:hypothetical protein